MYVRMYICSGGYFAYTTMERDCTRNADSVWGYAPFHSYLTAKLEVLFVTNKNYCKKKC